MKGNIILICKLVETQNLYTHTHTQNGGESHAWLRLSFLVHSSKKTYVIEH